MGQDNLKPDGIQGSLPLSDMPVLGSYRIQVQVAVGRHLFTYITLNVISSPRNI